MFKVFTDEYIAYILTFKKDFERMRRFLISIFFDNIIRYFWHICTYIAGKRVFFEFFNTTERDRDILRLRRCKRKILELLEVYFR